MSPPKHSPPLPFPSLSFLALSCPVPPCLASHPHTLTPSLHDHIYSTLHLFLRLADSLHLRKNHRQRLCVQVGSIGTMLLSLHFATHTIPKWEPLVTKNIERKGGDNVTICCLYAGLVVSSFMHNWAHFYLLRSTGAVSTGVLQSLRSIGVFAVSGWLFCDNYPTQCMTSLKSLACLIVSTGVLVYSYGSFISTKGACGGGALPDAPALSIPSDNSTLYDHENPHVRWPLCTPDLRGRLHHEMLQPSFDRPAANNFITILTRSSPQPMSPGCAGDGGKGSLWRGSGAAGDEHAGSRTPRRKGGGVGWLMRAVGMGSASAEFVSFLGPRVWQASLWRF